LYRALFAVLLLISSVGPSNAQPGRQNQKAGIYTVNALAKEGVSFLPLSDTSEPQSPLSDRRVVVYGPAGFCDLHDMALQDTEPGPKTPAVNIVRFIPNHGSRSGSYQLSWGASVIYSNINVDGVRRVSEDALQGAITECKKSLGANYSVSKQPIFAIEGIVRKVDTIFTSLGGLKGVKRLQYVVLAENFRFVGTESTGDAMRRVLAGQIPALVLKFAESFDQDQ
jgi:hypothetical protein